MRTRQHFKSPYSKRNVAAKLDGRTYAARVFNDFRTRLIAHVGGTPSVTQEAIIERACWVAVRCALFDKKIADDKFTDLDSRTYLAWCHSLSRLCAKLGLHPTDTPEDPDAEYSAIAASLDEGSTGRREAVAR